MGSYMNMTDLLLDQPHFRSISLYTCQQNYDHDFHQMSRFARQLISKSDDKTFIVFLLVIIRFTEKNTLKNVYK